MINLNSLFKKKAQNNTKLFDNIKILIIHVDKNFAENIKLFLTKKVKEVYCATDGMQGLELFNKYRPNLIICQSDIPALNGTELAKIFKKITSELSVILISNPNDTKALYEAVEAKIDKVIINPKDHIDEILEIIEDTLHDLKNKILAKTIECKEFFDPLTNIYNRKRMNEVITEKINIYKRFQTIFTIILLNIENLKQINSHYGHKMGDTILKDISKLIAENIRSIDIVGKWDNSKFVIVLPQTDLSNSIKLVKKLQSIISNKNFYDIGSLQVNFTTLEPTINDDIVTITKQLDDKVNTS